MVYIFLDMNYSRYIITAFNMRSVALEKALSLSSSRTHSVAFCGLCVAIMTVSAWITVPLGPVPFTLQVFAMVFAILVLTPREAVTSIATYLLMGAVGLPVFSSMRGGVGVLAGPTGGFLWGWLLGAVLVAAFLKIAGNGPGGRSVAIDTIAGFLFLVTCYACGWVQLAAVAHMGMAAAFATAIAPFVIVDTIKIIAAVFTARSVKKAIRR